MTETVHSLNFNKGTDPTLTFEQKKTSKHKTSLSSRVTVAWIFLYFSKSNLQFHKSTAMAHLAILLQFHICLGQQRILKWKCGQTDTHWFFLKINGPHSWLTTSRRQEKALTIVCGVLEGSDVKEGGANPVQSHFDITDSLQNNLSIQVFHQVAV